MDIHKIWDCDNCPARVNVLIAKCRTVLTFNASMFKKCRLDRSLQNLIGPSHSCSMLPSGQGSGSSWRAPDVSLEEAFLRQGRRRMMEDYEGNFQGVGLLKNSEL